MADTAFQIRALENFVSGNKDLNELEALASRFNIFEVLGVVNAELRHSSFLAFLLNPGESHGLRDLFLKRFLQAALQGSPDVTSITPIEIDIGDFSRCEVLLERDNIDVLLLDAEKKLAIIIENKINSDLHSDQLNRYYNQTKKRKPTYDVFGIYLSRYENEASGHNKFTSISHAKVCELVQEVMTVPKVMLDSDVKVILRQYTEMLGRHFMADEKIQELCVKIYQHHKHAIDLIIENLPNQRNIIAERLKSLILQEKDLIFDSGGAGAVRFIPNEMDIPYFKGGSGWTKSGRMILFEIQNTPSNVQICLYLGPGDGQKRSFIFKIAHDSKAIFSTEKTMYPKWNRIYTFPMLVATDYKMETEELLAKLELTWKRFLTDELPRISKLLTGVAWPDPALN